VSFASSGGTQRLAPEHVLMTEFFSNRPYAKNSVSLSGYEVLRVVSVKRTIFWVVTPSDTSKKQGCVCRLLHSDSLLGLFFHPEDAGDKFLRNVCGLLPNYTALQA
jgi:hypothetical protein